MSSSECVFCKIIRGDIPSFTIAENEAYLAILDISQFTEGHTIVIPKDHVETIWESDDICGYFDFVQKIGKHLKSVGFKYADTLTMGRMVPHAHVHVIPHNGDNTDWERALETIGSYQQDSSRHPSKEEGESLVKKFAMT